jgi:hypothetical protein
MKKEQKKKMRHGVSAPKLIWSFPQKYIEKIIETIKNIWTFRTMNMNI